MSRSVRNWGFLLVVILAVLAADQITKQWVLDNLLLNESYQPIPALSPFFQLTRSYNTGSAFGFLPQASDVFLVIAIVIVTLMLYFYPRVPQGVWLMRLAIGLICGGALGNALDRLQHGQVIDFIHYQIPGLISNVSNLADHAIVLGVIAIFIQTWRSDRAKARQPEGEAGDGVSVREQPSERLPETGKD